MSGKDGDRWLRENASKVTSEALKSAFERVAARSSVKASATYVALRDDKRLPPLEVMREAMAELGAPSMEISGGANTITFKLLKAGGIEIERK